MRRLFLALVALLCGVAVFLPWRPPPRVPMLDEAATPPPAIPVLAASDTPQSIDELRTRIAAVLDREGVPGVGIALVGRDGPIWIGGVGVADTITQVPVGADTVFRAASITKSVIALGVMRLVEQGRLALDRPLREIVPDAGIDNAWDAEAPVTLAQVLEHTAGLDDLRPNEMYTDDDAMTPAAALAINPRSRIVRWRPGTRMAYSNVGYTLAARAIEVATGEPFDAWLRREVLRPLGMADADFRRTGALASRLATGYRDRDRPARFAPIAHRPAGALLVSAAELAKLVQFWLRRGDDLSPIVSPAGLDRIERTGTLPYPPTDLNYGLGNHGDVSQPVRGRGHDGGLPGFATSLRYFPELGLGYVMLLNATHSLRAYSEIRALLFAYLVRDRQLPAVAIGAPSSPPGADCFAFASPRHAMFGFIERAVLGWRAGATADGVRLDPLFGRAIDLVPTPDGGYRAPGESGSSVRFARNRDGTPVMLIGSGYAEASSWWLARARTTGLAIALLLLRVAPLWLIEMLCVAALRRRRAIAVGLVVWPALAGLCMIVLPRLAFEASVREVAGTKNPLTIAICATTIGFAIAACAGVIAALRWARRPDRPPWWARLVPSLSSVGALAIAIWFAANGIIGLRTWAW